MSTTRRAHLTGLGLGLGLLAGTLAGSARAAAADPVPPGQLQVYAKRKQITLPEVATPGITYIATFDLTDASGAPVGEAAAGNSVLDVTVDGPVVLSQVVLRLAKGELHYQRLMNRFGNFPRSATGAILGGTGTYATARGDVQIVWPDQNTIQITANLA
jgi:hypothetical protein